MSSNTRGGSYRTTGAAVMRAYDQLPPAAPRAFANAIVDWAPQSTLRKYRNGHYSTGDEIAKTVARADKAALQEYERQRARAAGPYKGNIPDQVVRR